MAVKSKKPIDYQSLPSHELVWLAQIDDDKGAVDEIYARKMVVAKKIAKAYCRRYTFVDVDDMSQSILLVLPNAIRTYRPGRKNTDWDKYCYHRLYFMAKDILRQRDDLGIKWPQKKQYPTWHHLGDEALERFDAEDHRAMVDREALQFFEDIENWREAFAISRTQAKPFRKALAPSRDPAPTAWSEGKYLGEVQPTKKSKSSIRDIASWKIHRAKPKQMALFQLG